MKSVYLFFLESGITYFFYLNVLKKMIKWDLSVKYMYFQSFLKSSNLSIHVKVQEGKLLSIQMADSILTLTRRPVTPVENLQNPGQTVILIYNSTNNTYNTNITKN